VRTQIGDSLVSPIEEYADNYGSLEFEVRGKTRAPVTQRVPVYATALDADGVPIELLLHVVDGLVQELEVVEADGSPIKRPPQAADLHVTVRTA
jgi:hypothetical protein